MQSTQCGGGVGAARAARPGPSLPIWWRHRAPRPAPRPAPRDNPRDARRGLNAILRASRRLGVRIEDLGRLHGAQLLMRSSRRTRELQREPHREPRDPETRSHQGLTIAVAVLGAVLAGILAAMLVADADRHAERHNNKSMGGTLKQQHQSPDGDIPAYLLEALQSNRNHQLHEDDFILGYHDDYRERYDGFDQPPPFRQSRPRNTASGYQPGKGKRLSDVEISEEEAFSTRVFVTTPRRQR